MLYSYFNHISHGFVFFFYLTYTKAFSFNYYVANAMNISYQ